MAQCGQRKMAASIARSHVGHGIKKGSLAWAANVILDELEALEKERQAELDAVVEGPETEAG